MSEVVKKATELYEKYNPLDNEVKFEGGEVKWKIKPDLDLLDTEFDVQFQKDLVKDQVELIVEIDGKATVFESGPNDENLKIKPTIKGSHDLEDDVHIDWSVQPGISFDDPVDGLKKTQYQFKFSKEFKDKDIKISFNVAGDVTAFTSPPGQGNFKAGFSFSKKF